MDLRLETELLQHTFMPKCLRNLRPASFWVLSLGGMQNPKTLNLETPKPPKPKPYSRKD